MKALTNTMGKYRRSGRPAMVCRTPDATHGAESL